MLQLAFVQWSQDEILVLEGPLSFLEKPQADAPCLYAPDFFLAARTPWIVGARHSFLTRQEWDARYGGAVSGKTGIRWTAPDQDYFRRAFDDLSGLLANGTLKKGVPLTATVGALDDPEATLRHALARVASLHANVTAYGLCDGHEALIGATPELLFQCRPGELRTMALAGTRPNSAENRAALRTSTKDQHEHGLVLAFIIAGLERFGTVQVQDTRVEDYGQLCHLMTPVLVHLNGPPVFDELVRSLHPTPALGVFPHNAEGRQWLATLNSRKQRDRFGAPFGALLPDGTMKCWVAIRNMQITQTEARIWAGCGVVPESQYEHEWSEVCAKIDAVRHTWGLA